MWGHRTKPLISVLLASVLVGTSAIAAETYGPTRPGDGAYSIVAKYRTPGSALSLTQWVNALYQLNPDAFNGSPDRLKSGVTLQLPTAEQVSTLQAGRSQAPPGQAPRSALFYAERQVPVPEPIMPAKVDTENAVASPATPLRPETSTKFISPDLTSVAESPPVDDGLLAVQSAENSAAFAESELYRQTLRVIGSAEAASALQDMADAEAQYAGDAEFDYLYGVLLLDHGQADQALFALQRAVQQRPSELGFKIDLARAYFETNDNASAQIIFEHLAQSNPPAAAAEVIESYLQAIKRRASRYESTWSSQIALQLGHDSNANAATELRQFIGFELADAARSTSSDFAEISISSQYAQPLTARWRWLIGGQASYRSNLDASELNTTLYGLQAGVGYRRGLWDLSVIGGANQLDIDGEKNALRSGLTGSWSWSLSKFSRLQSSLRLGTTRYQDTLSIRDVDNLLGGLGLNYRAQWLLGSEIGLTLLLGQDDAVNDSSPYGRSMFGALALLRLQITPRLRLNSNIQSLNSDYDGEFFGSERQDDLVSAALALEFTDQRYQGWLLSLRLFHQQNNSNLGLFDYKRSTGSVQLSYTYD